MSEVSFTVYGRPEPQGSVRAFVRPGIAGGKPRAALTSDNSKLRPFRSEVTRCALWALHEAGLEEPMADKHVPVAIQLICTFRKPESVSKRRTGMVVKPDLDKLVRACLDSLTGVLFKDDGQVVALTATKVYGQVDGVQVFARIVE